VADRLRPAVRAVCATILPPEAGGPSPEELAGQVLNYMGQMPPVARKASGLGFVGVATAMRVAARGTSAEALPVHRRTALMSRLVATRPEVAAAVDGVKAVVMLVYGANRHAEEITSTARAAPPVRPDAALYVVASPQWPSTSRADAVVIGSGAGGAFAARTLARAGVEVVVVEEGRRWSVDELRSMHPLDRYSRLYRDAGTTVALGWPPVVLPIGRAVGGTTVVNSGTCYRPPGGVLTRWRDEFGLALADPGRLDPLFDDVEQTLAVAPAPLEVMGNNGKLALAGAAALGWEAAPIPRNAPGCCGCCQCALGCPRNAKYGVHLNALPQACDSGARILSEARVRRILHEDGHTTAVVAQRPDGSEIVIRTACVVVAAGAGETPMLLWRSGLGEHPELGRNMAIHPALSVTGRFADPVLAWKGVLQSAAIHELHDREGILIEATSTPPGMGSMVLPGHGPELLAAVADAEHHAQLGAMIGDEGSGRVQSVRGHTVLRYDLCTADARRLLTAVDAMGRVLLAAGAEKLLTGIPGPAPSSVEELEASVAGANPRHLHLAAFHPTGTARAGSDPQRCPVDAEGRLRGVHGVWVADACTLPSCPEVNPQVSIMALSMAVAEGMLEHGLVG
jgi:choline dehydrogenase-like flavoprotein